eukprot:203316-Pelagomonas_calceolata.AAC.1
MHTGCKETRGSIPPIGVRKFYSCKGIQIHADPASCHWETFQVVPSNVTHNAAFQGVPRSVTHNAACQGVLSNVTHNAAFQGVPSNATQNAAFQGVLSSMIHNVDANIIKMQKVPREEGCQPVSLHVNSSANLPQLNHRAEVPTC